MASYHLSPQGPRACSTTPTNCPFGRAGGEHYDNIAEAQLNFEKNMETQYGLVGLAQAAKNRQTASYKLYEQLDQVQRESDIYKKVALAAAYSRASPNKSQRGGWTPNGRSAGYNRQRRSGPSGVISRMAKREGKKLLQSVGPTPRNIIKLHSYLTKELIKATR